MRVAIATDAWMPQVNGVVRTLSTTVNQLMQRGHEIELITPERFFTVPMPGYSEIRLAIAPRFGARRALSEFGPDLVHIATEGPIGWSARAWCLAHDKPFTSAFHTRFPDYAAVRTGLSPDRFWPIMRRFHKPSRAVLAATPALMAELSERAIPHTKLWSRGVDTEIFHPDQPALTSLAHLPRPIYLSVGRVAKEKNLGVFLACEVEGTKVVVGDGPMLEELKQRYPDVVFTGALQGTDLAGAYTAADVFVFPSKTDTFGLVMIEALACGTPIAGFPVAGPLDIVGREGRGPTSDLEQPVGALSENLQSAILEAIKCRPTDAARYGRTFSWQRCTDQFESALQSAAIVKSLTAA